MAGLGSFRCADSSGRTVSWRQCAWRMVSATCSLHEEVVRGRPSPIWGVCPPSSSAQHGTRSLLASACSASWGVGWDSLQGVSSSLGRAAALASSSALHSSPSLTSWMPNPAQSGSPLSSLPQVSAQKAFYLSSSSSLSSPIRGSGSTQ